jgi:hypothetical protein
MSANLIAQISEISAPIPKVTGGVLFAPLGTAIPTDATSPLDPAFVTLGRVSSDGVDKTETRKTTDFFDWGGNLIAVLQDSFSISVKFKLLQLMNADVQAAAHGTGNVTVVPPTTNTGTTIKSLINATLLNVGIWVIDAYYDKLSMRFVIPHGRPTEVGPVKWVHKELAMYDLTVRPFPDDVNNHAYEYWNDGVMI